jgi:hypothetical protein
MNKPFLDGAIATIGIDIVTCFPEFGPSDLRKFSVRLWCRSRRGFDEAVDVPICGRWPDPCTSAIFDS